MTLFFGRAAVHFAARPFILLQQLLRQPQDLRGQPLPFPPGDTTEDRVGDPRQEHTAQADGDARQVQRPDQAKVILYDYCKYDQSLEKTYDKKRAVIPIDFVILFC